MYMYTYSQTEEIGLKIITTAKISNKFHSSPCTYQTRFVGISKKIQTGFHVSKLIPRYSNKWGGNPPNLEIQISGDPNMLCLISSMSGVFF